MLHSDCYSLHITNSFNLRLQWKSSLHKTAPPPHGTCHTVSCGPQHFASCHFRQRVRLGLFLDVCLCVCVWWVFYLGEIFVVLAH